tara:strand:+ start:7732 stop:8424 length:693 start_codon:yes stop_codon:yes gene_type:complete
MAYLTANIPYFKVWIRREFTHNHRNYHGEFLHGLAIAVTAIPDRSLSFQVVFTGCEDEENRVTSPHGGAMWARMPIQSLVADEELEQFPPRIPNHFVQPWDCSSRHFSIVRYDRTSSSPWIVKIDGQFYNAKYYFTIDYTNGDEITSLGDDVAQHKQSHILAITNGEFAGQIVAQPNNRVRVTNPALWVTGSGAPDFIPSQHEFAAEEDESYMDPNYTFNNLYSNEDTDK